MVRWTCGECGRDFGKVRQGHMCAPGMTLEEYFAQAQPWEEPVFEVVEQHLSALAGDDLIIDPINMGIMFKHGPMVCEMRSMKRWVALGFILDRRLSSSRLSRKVIDYQGKFFHVINVDDPAAIDNEVKEWLTEALYRPTGGGPPGGDPMVPDDVDVDL